MCARSHYSGSQMYVDQTKPLDSAMGTCYRQIRPPAGVAQSSFSAPSDLTFQPMGSHPPSAQVPPIRQNSRGNRSVTTPPYHSIRTPSFPVQSVSPDETEIQTCQWMRDDGTSCGAPITGTVASVSQHLTTHGIKDKASHLRLQCRWLGCRLRGDRDTLKRESMVRHVREKHLGWKRSGPL